jgi:poly-gamma-glutamate synthesis protein (capsule biosynthesis protein)
MGLALLARPARAQVVTVVAGGDVIVHRSVALTAAAHAAEGGFGWVLAPLRAELPERAVALANLESPLSEQRRRPGDSAMPILGADPGLAAALGAAGFDVVSLANNHAFDQMGEGLFETTGALRAAGVAFAGAGPTDAAAVAATVVERDGVRVGVVAFTDHLNAATGRNPHHVFLALAADPGRVAAALRAARRRADVVVLAIHWGRDFAYAPTAAQRARARRWVEAGADLIVGTGPHVLQRVERVASPRGDAVIAWSLGNLVSNQGARYQEGSAPPRNDAGATPFARDGALLRVTLERRADRSVRLRALEAVPLWTEHAEGGCVRASPLREAPPSLRAARRAAIARALGSAVTLRE